MKKIINVICYDSSNCRMRNANPFVCGRCTNGKDE